MIGNSSRLITGHLNDRQVGAVGVARKQRVKCIFFCLRGTSQYQPVTSLTTKYHRHLLQSLEGRMILAVLLTLLKGMKAHLTSV